VYSRKRSPYLWINYYQHGRPVRESTGTKNEVGRTPDAACSREGDEINRELTVLRRMFSLAIEAGKPHHKPHFAMLREDNVRVGFFEREQHESVLAHLPAGMRPVVTFAYVTGWRISSEVLPLQWRQVDLRVVLRGVAASSDGRRLSGEHPARLPADHHPQYGPGRHSGAGGDEIERSQDPQRFRSL
jgi:integrase